MNRRYLICFLAILIALQSVVAVADVHKFHQSGAQHLSFEHEHQGDAQASLADMDKSPAESKDRAIYQPDCHHCCHCHGSSHIFLISRQDVSASLYQRGAISDYRSRYHSHIGFPENPPPIA